jgi:hypothetical protein
MRTRHLAWVLAVGACGGGGSGGVDAHPQADSAPTADAAPLATIGAAPDLLTAADPKLDGFDGWPIAFDLEAGGQTGVRCQVTIARAQTMIAVLDGTITGGRCVATWDGKGTDGKIVAPGVVSATAAILPATGVTPLARTMVSLEVVRLGVVEVHLESADKVPLMYGALGHVAHGYWLVPSDRAAWRIGPKASEGLSAVRLEMADGTPRALPMPWDDLRSPPQDMAAMDGVEADDFSLPSAFVAGGDVAITATLSSDIAGAPNGGAPVQSMIQVVAPANTTINGDATFTAGGQVGVHGALAPAVGRYDTTLRWTFAAKAPNGSFVAIPGGQSTEIVVYGTAGQPIFDYTTTPHHAWVEVVDRVTRWINGSTSDPLMVAHGIVEGVYYTMGLTYDVQSGASAYTNYPGAGFENAQFDLSSLSTLAFGNIINCSDAASIVSTYANMMGVDLRYHILTQPSVGSFDLNFIMAIGGTMFTQFPFTGGRGRFSYHAVTGPPDGSFYDATLALDGDGDPLSLPSTALLAEGMMPNDYLYDLSSEWMGIVTTMDQKVEIQ